jgi:hypothetical protein
MSYIQQLTEMLSRYLPEGSEKDTRNSEFPLSWSRFEAGTFKTSLYLYHYTSKFGLCYLFFTMAQQPPVGQCLLIVEASRSHSVRHIALGRTPMYDWSDQPDVRDLYLTTQQHSKQRDIQALGGIRTTIPASERPQTHALTLSDPTSDLFRQYDFFSSAPTSEDVRNGFCCVCSPAVGACPTLFLM